MDMDDYHNIYLQASPQEEVANQMMTSGGWPLHRDMLDGSRQWFCQAIYLMTTLDLWADAPFSSWAHQARRKLSGKYLLPVEAQQSLSTSQDVSAVHWHYRWRTKEQIHFHSRNFNPNLLFFGSCSFQRQSWVDSAIQIMMNVVGIHFTIQIKCCLVTKMSH